MNVSSELISAVFFDVPKYSVLADTGPYDGTEVFNEEFFRSDPLGF